MSKLDGKAGEREIKIYLKIDYIQSLIMHQIQTQNYSQNEGKSSAYGYEIGHKKGYNDTDKSNTRSQSCHLTKNLILNGSNTSEYSRASPSGTYIKHLNLNKIFSGYCKSSLNCR